ncbi:MAG: 50S ribosomal protein L17 [Deltaproteobacteria bacterium]|jgi:large subunit ribosomal protein L17|nr:50S ribosomal protein L17 [Deltaproteobacteria bacterium]
MSSHKKLTKRFSRRNGPKKMLIKGLLVNLITHNQMVTTKAKAFEIKRLFDKSVTLAKKNNLNSFRLLMARLSNKEAASKLLNEIAPRMLQRNGGYTTVVKMPNRSGDNSPMAFIKIL